MGEPYKLGPPDDTGVSILDKGLVGLSGIFGTTAESLRKDWEGIGGGALKSFFAFIGKALEAWDKEGEDNVLKLLDKLFEGLNIPGEARKALIAGAKKLSLDLVPLRTLSALFSTLSAVGQTIKLQAGLASPFMARSFGNLVKPNRPDHMTLLRYFWRYPSTDKVIANKTWWNDAFWGHGYDNDSQRVIDYANRLYLGRPDIEELYRRGILTHDEARIELDKMGMRTASVEKQALILAKRLPDRGSLDELWRRGRINTEQWKKHVEALGFTKPTVDLLSKTVHRLLDPSVLVPALHRGLITPDNFIKSLKALGYPEGKAKVLKSASYFPVPPDVVTRGFHRGIFTENQAITRLKDLGFAPDSAASILDVSYLLATPADLIRFAVREVYDPVIRKKFGQDLEYPEALTTEGAKIGFPEKVLKDYWAAHWVLPSPGQAYDMFHRGLITSAELNKLFVALDFMPGWRDKLIAISHRLIPRRSLPRLIKQELITLSDLVARFKALGYSPKNSLIMGKSAVLAAETDKRTLAKGEVIDAYANGVIDEPTLISHLQELDYGEDSITYYMYKADQKRIRIAGAKAGPDLLSETKRIKELTRQEVLRGFAEGLLEAEKATELLLELGFPQEAVTAMLSYETFRAMREDRDKHTAQVKRLFDAGLLDVVGTEQKLTNLGYVPQQSRRLTNLWGAERDADTQLATQQDKIGTKADYETWLKMGIIDVPTWVGAMRRLQFTDETINYNLQEIAAKLTE